jgi:hypothetical protein
MQQLAACLRAAQVLAAAVSTIGLVLHSFRLPDDALSLMLSRFQRGHRVEFVVCLHAVQIASLIATTCAEIEEFGREHCKYVLTQQDGKMLLYWQHESMYAMVKVTAAWLLAGFGK